MTNEKRKHTRTPIQLKVRLKLNRDKFLIAETWDISDGGIGIQIPKSDEIIWTVNMPVTAQVQGLPEPGPELAMRVVRIDHDRIGFQFFSDKKSE